MDFFKKIFRKEESRYAETVVPGAVTLLLAAIAAVCSLTLPPQLVNASYPLSTAILFLYVMLVYFFSCTLVRVLTIATKLKYHRTLKFALMIVYILVMRLLTISLHRPRLLFQTMFFTPQGYLENFYAESTGVLFIDVCIFLALAVFGTRYIADFRRAFVLRHRKSAGVMLALELFVVLALTTLVPYNVGLFSAWGRFELNPCNMMNFDANTFMLIFILFAFAFGSSLLFNKVAGAVFRYFQRKTLPSLLFIAGIFALNFLFCVVCKSLFFGFPVWLWQLFLFAHIVISLLGMRHERRNYRFFIVVGKILVFAFITASLVLYQGQKRDGEARKQLVDKLVVSTQGLTVGGEPQGDAEDVFSGGVYSERVLPIGYAWVVKSARHLDRQVIMSHPDETALTSFAYYVDGRLVDLYGGFDYMLDLDSYLDDIRFDTKHSCLIANGYRHFVYPVSEGETVIVSHRLTSQFSLLAAFSFYFIVYMLFYALTLLVVRPFIRMARPLSLYNNLLWLVIFLLMIVGVGMSTLSIHYSYNRWENDRAGLIKVKLGKVERDLYRASRRMNLPSPCVENVGMDSVLEKLLGRYDLFIAVYDTEGRRICRAYTDLAVQSKVLSASVLASMRNGNSYCRTRECTDYRDVFCLYKVIMDGRGEVLGYLSGADIRNRYTNNIKMSDLITKHLHFFGWLILLIIVTSGLIYVIIYRSMGGLEMAMRRRNRPYSPIRLDWEVNEEIGALVREHNEMVDELRRNAVQMAKSERETAWREMALEISHEVRNPLTPMRLKMQMLQKVLLSGSPDLRRRIIEATDEVIRQTDTLAEVADTFSEFAGSQAGVNEDTDIRKVLAELADELPGLVHAHYDFRFGPLPEYRALVDRRLFRKMITYLVKNSDHNRMEHGRLEVTVMLDESDEAAFWLLSFAANDRGLDHTDEASVFTVKFSHENCGHSLCLPIVKNIVVSFNGTLTFETGPQSGTKFFIKIPKLEENSGL